MSANDRVKFPMRFRKASVQPLLRLRLVTDEFRVTRALASSAYLN